ncbi:hypothetical protein BC828DRAFT_403155 [Blastocladiella britannica]|nr:hypothetical protein BC828DRAFT_403155 [Blastocladiella britannica]
MNESRVLSAPAARGRPAWMLSRSSMARSRSRAALSVRARVGQSLAVWSPSTLQLHVRGRGLGQLRAKWPASYTAMVAGTGSIGLKKPRTTPPEAYVSGNGVF